MALSDELDRLATLHERGVLSAAEFAQAKARVLGGGPGAGAAGPAVLAINALRRSRTDRWLGGVCGGVARITGVEAWVWRLVFTLLAMFAGTGVLAYVLLWLLVPSDPPVPGPVPVHPQAG